MVQLKTQRTALVLYALLLVLPTAILGTLHWYELWRDHQARMEGVPMALEDAGRRLAFAIESRIVGLVDIENHRPFDEYQALAFGKSTAPDEPELTPTPLHRVERAEGLEFWFSYNFEDGPEAPFRTFHGASPPRETPIEEHYQRALRKVIASDWADSESKRETRRNEVAFLPYKLPKIALNQKLLADEIEGKELSSANLEPLRQILAERPELAETAFYIPTFGLSLRFFVEEDGRRYVMAMRNVLFEAQDSLAQESNESLAWFSKKHELVQGFFLDADWLFSELPWQEAERVLDRSMTLAPKAASKDPLPGMLFSRPVEMVTRLDLEIPYDINGSDYEAFCVTVSVAELEAVFWRQSWRFFAVATLLAISLGLGMLLLMRSVHKDLEQARRTENFVAAVTHELRTPLTAIRLYSEMLHDGWVNADRKRREYYARILRETGRLETLVERVLSKARLSSSPMSTRIGDLAQSVEHLLPSLLEQSEGDDLAFLAESELPPVHLNPDAVRSILTNLVENARKYAADPVHGEAGEAPILVEVRSASGAPVLEVSDRGVGIPVAERKRIFEAFYRSGTEATRTAKGTGLGLHLVAIQSEAMGGRAEVLEREGGGTTFRIHFKLAKGPMEPEAIAEYDLPRPAAPEASQNGHENEEGDAAHRAGTPS